MNFRIMMGTDFFTKQRPIATLAIFRIAFGAALFLSTVRFMLKGWVSDFYLKPRYHFPFFGFEWLHPLTPSLMYAVYLIMAIAALFICIGFYYRLAAVVFFLSFFYTEMLDKTYYLNHYYLVSIVSFLLILVPANRYLSIDVWRRPLMRSTHVPAWTIVIFRFQLCIVYFFAGLSKLTHDWLFEALPLKIWLQAKTDIPIIGPLFHHHWVAYLFSWFGALFDLFIPFFLLNKQTRLPAYIIVVIFHTMTAVLFQIGMFPYFMITATLIFFFDEPRKVYQSAVVRMQKPIFFILIVFFIFQLLVPMRFLLYPGRLMWTEEGYRFSWRVMLMEKGGAIFFHIKNPETGKRFEVDNSEFLTPYQERMMETQPDMMLQYAHILKEFYSGKGIRNPVVTAESYVGLNGRGSRLFIDSSVNLAAQRETLFGHKTWILPKTE
jgi:Vitamin K-dependent gamma-carboxylase